LRSARVAHAGNRDETEEQDMTEIFFAQKAFIVRNRELLLVRKSAEDPNQPGLWEVPGGRMIFGEEVDEHLKREVREEVGLEVLPGAPFHVWQWWVERKKPDSGVARWQIVAVARVCKPLSTELSSSGRVEEDYLAEMAWVPFSDLSRYSLIPNMLPVIDLFLKLVGPNAVSDDANRS
jgi:8-oxo-dGTP pyrophosphatase MutT (NUDIX family)